MRAVTRAVLTKRGITSGSTTNVAVSDGVAKERVDAVVIGAGVVGIAVARHLAVEGRRDVLVLDSAPSFGTGTSSRNSQVIHAGIYYPSDSLKARLCVRGRDLLYEYCSARGIPHSQTGKLIVATSPSGIPKLGQLMDRASLNGVVGLRWLDGSEAQRMEPNLQCVKALLSPLSGIVDSHSLMLSLLGDAESAGATFSYNSTVIGGHVAGDDSSSSSPSLHLHVVQTRVLEEEDPDGEAPIRPELVLVPRLVVNSAGLAAWAVARRLSGGLDGATVPPAYFARGCYFTLSNTRSPPFSRLIYPLPEDGGLGVHVTLDLDGQVKFGPDVEWIHGLDDIPSFLNKYDYSVDPNRAGRFYPEIRKYYPALKDGCLEPGYAGVRPKISGPRQSSGDFVDFSPANESLHTVGEKLSSNFVAKELCACIQSGGDCSIYVQLLSAWHLCMQGEDTHGVPGLVNLYGIESPGLTSSMAIAEHIAARFLK
ncbi:hypothetical protein Tsubulata_023083 [Turnera subulata]|uniref:L-2-hydroxyglutarate dehydrogenase, mitochondrial n=1 Tax=Turnera subulata TaxID=218843 RepID=A0A9Q0JCS0_9ROSI|nr:hypothetical protein Tsubulata_023083 [Turnera subulata]